MKKFFSLVLALVMALSLTTVAWGAGQLTPDASGKITLTGNIVLATGDKLTVGNGETVTITGSGSIDASALVDPFQVDEGGKLIIDEGVTITSTSGNVLYANGGAIVVDGVVTSSGNATVAYVSSKGSLTVNGSITVSGAGKAICVDGANASATVNGGTVEATHSSDIETVQVLGGTFTVDGGEVSSAASSAIAIGTTGGTVKIKDGTVSTDAAGTIAAAFGYSGTIEVTGGTIENTNANNDSVALAAGGAAVEVSGGNVESVAVTGTGGAVEVSGGTFSVLPSEDYLADGYTFVGNSVEKPSKKTNTYEGLYAKSTNAGADVDPVAVEVVVTPAKAVKYEKTTGDLEEWGVVEHVNITGDSVDYVFVNSVKEADVVLYKDADGKFVKFYLDAIETPDYVEGVVFNNFGDDCGEVDYDEDDGYDKKLKYFTIKGTGDEFVLVEEAEEYACDFYVMYNSKLVPVVELDLDKVPHKVVTESEDGDLVKVYCSACGTQAVKAPNMMSVPKGAELVDGTGTEIWYWPVVGGSVSTETKVESAATFDAGIALYVGMSVMAAAGSVVVIGKKKD